MRGIWRTTSTAFWLGWKIQSNWTDPMLFLAYSLLRPLAAALIIVFMYFAVAGGERGPLLWFLVVGTAFWPLVLNGIQGIARSVLQDRENYRTITQLYSAPISYRIYLLGRAAAQTIAGGAPSVVVTLALGWVALDLPMRVADPWLLIAASILGLAAILAVGLFAAGITVSVASHSWQLPDALAAALFLVTGTIFPVHVLPGWLEGIASALPLTWWLECVRRALLGPEAVLSFPGVGDAAAFGALAGLTVVWGGVAAVWYAAAERRARRIGIFDRVSGY